MGGLKFYDTGSTLIDRPKDAPVPDFTNGKERANVAVIVMIVLNYYQYMIHRLTFTTQET